jgi:hypothetical protein
MSTRDNSGRSSPAINVLNASVSATLGGGAFSANLGQRRDEDVVDARAVANSERERRQAIENDQKPEA